MESDPPTHTNRAELWVFGVLLGMGLNPRGLEAGAGASPSASE